MLDSNVSTYIDKDGNVQEVGSGGTIDANTLNGLLSGSNGIAIAKNAAGDKVEVKIPNEITISNSQGMAKLSPQTISLFYKPDNVSFLIDGLAGGMYKTNGSEQQWYLHQGNVKTIGGQSIYGSGDIPILESYPVGSIYLSTFSTSPSSLFGGTWEQIKDVFLLAAGDTYTAGSTGGSANAVVVRHGGHVRPSDVSSGNIATADWEVAPNSSNSYFMNIDKLSAYGDRRAFTKEFGNEVGFRTLYKGESGTGKNMPPYLTVYMWERIL